MKNLKVICLIFALIFMSISVTACSNLTGKLYRTVNYFGAEIAVAIYDDFSSSDNVSKFTDKMAELDTLASEVNASISLTQSGSYVNAFNDADAGETVIIDKCTYDVMSLSKEYYDITDGAFDPAIYNLVDLWGFSSRHTDIDSDIVMPYDREDYASELPSDDYITAFASLTGFGDIELNVSADGEYTATKPDISVAVDGISYTMSIDLGGIGKGYIADLIADELIASGYIYGYVSVGQSSLRVLSNSTTSDGLWSVGISNPADDTKLYANIMQSNKAIGTSGNYYRSYDIDGTTYCHIIDPFTGYPTTENIDIATIVTQSASMADAYSTAVCVSGLSGMSDTLTESCCEYILAKPNGDTYDVYTNMTEKSYEIVQGGFYVV